MKNLILCYLAVTFFVFGSQPVALATNPYSKAFTSKDLFGSSVFIENKDIYEPYQGQKVEYILSHKGMVAFFTKQGVIYKLCTVKKEDEAEEAKERSKGKKDGPDGAMKARYYYVQMQWDGANPDPEIVAEGKQEGDQIYLKKDGDSYRTIHSQGYQKITYKDLYPGIDVEYVIPDKGGIEYNLIVHPGADVNQVKMNYGGDVDRVTNNAGDVIIKSKGGDITEHAPKSYYATSGPLASPFQVKDKSIQFKLPDNYDKTRTLIIDPWVTTLTTLTTSEVGYIVDYDYNGNLFVYGGGAYPQQYKIVKYYYGGGAPAYTFNGYVAAENWNSWGIEYDPGSFAVDKPTGKAYMGQGLDDENIGTYYYAIIEGSNQIIRIDSFGNYDNFISSINENFMEAWGFTYNCANSTILIAGGSFTNNINFGILNPLTATVNSINITGITTNSDYPYTCARQDIASLAENTQGNVFAIFSEPYSGAPQNPDVGNKIYELNAGLNSYVWNTPSGYKSLNEFQNHPAFVNPEAREVGDASGNGYNGLAANNNYVFYYDGYNLKAFNAATGAATGTPTTISGGTVLYQGGIAVDNCNNVYVGSVGAIKTFTFNGSTFTPGADISLGSGYTTADVYDVRFNSANNMLYVTGIGFAGIYPATLSNTCVTNLLSITTYNQCTGATAILTPSNTVSSPTFTYVWTNTAGTIVSQTNNTTDTVNSITGVPSGKYYIKAYMNLNCAASFQLDSVNVGAVVSLKPNDTTICNGQSVTITAVADTAGGTYVWSPGGQTTSSITVTPGSTTTYTVSYSVCNTQDSTVVNVSPKPTLAPTNGTVCKGDTITVYANPSVGGGTYSWTPGGYTTDSFKIVGSSDTIYTVVYTVPGCASVSDSAVINITPPPTLTAPASVPMCQGGSAKIYATPSVTGGTYSWSPGGATTDTVVVSPPVTTTYIVTYTLGCSAVDSVVATITEAPPGVSISTPSAMVCPGASVPLKAIVTPVTCGAAIGSGSCGSGNPPVPVSYGTGSDNTEATPFAGFYTSSMYQALYRADSLTAAGITAGTIVQLQLTVATVSSTNPFTNFSIQMGCTGDNQLNLYNWEPVNTVVYSTNSYTPTVGTNTFVFNQPYNWDGVSNLVIQICFSTTTAPGDNDEIVSTNMLYPASMVASTDSVYNLCAIPANQISPSNLDYSVPNITLSFCTASAPNYTYLWSPSTNLTSTTTDTTTANSVTQPESYSVKVSDALCTVNDTIRLTVDTATLSLSPRDTTLCGPDTVQLSVNLNGTLPIVCGPNGNTCAGPAAYIQVDSSTTDNSDYAYPAPFGNFYPSAMQQYLYPAADLLAAGVVPGRITQIAFWVQGVDNTSTTEYDFYSLQAGCSSATSLSIGSPVAGLTTVYNPRTVNLVNSPGWVNFVLDTAIDWDGTSSLVIQNCFDNTNTTNPIGTFSGNAQSAYVTTGNVVTSTVYASNTSQACYNPSPTSLAFVSGDSSRPIMRLNMCQPPLPYTISWSPGATLNDSTSKTPLALPTKTTTYYVTVVSPSGCTKKDSLTINVGSLAPVTAKDTAACVGSQLQLTAEGGDVYSWTPAAGLSCTTCPNPIVTVDSNIQYIVTITDTTKGCTAYDTINIVALNAPTIPYTNDTVFCIADSVAIDAGSGDSLYVWSPSNPIPNDSIYEVKTPGTYSVTVTGFNGCTVSDTITIHQFAQPVVNLGNDTSVCAPDTLTLSAGGPYVSYSWNTGASTQTINVDSTGEYSVTVTDANGCISSDSILVGINPTPVISLGGPDTACYTDSVRLAANNGPTYTYLWSTGSTDSVIEVTNLNAGEIYVTVSGGGPACSSIDSVNVYFRPPVSVFIGDDTTICIGDSVTFSAGLGFADYVWSNGDSGAAVTSITVKAAGTYYVTVTDSHGCMGYDSATLTLTQDSIYLGPDTSVCLGTTLILGNRLGNPFVSYHWNTGATTDTIQVSATGSYSLTATPASGCPGIDTIVVTFVPAPVITFPLALTAGICPGTVDTLSPGPQPAGTTYHWNNGTTDSFVLVTTGGTYAVTVTNATGCSSSDSIVIPNLAPPVVKFLQNTSVCIGDSTTINAYNPNYTYTAYLWNTGATTDSIVVTDPGIYRVTVTGTNGCTAADSESIANFLPITINLSNFDLCHNVDSLLNVGSNYVSYAWYVGGVVTSDAADTFLVTGPGTYSVLVTDSNGCHGGDTIAVAFNPPVTPVFTPDTVSVCPSVGYTLYPGKFRTYYWSTGITNSTLTVDTSGEYYVTVTDDNGCPGTDSAHVYVYPNIVPAIQGDTLLCSLTPDTLSSVAQYPSYLWSNGDTTQTIVVTIPGTYGLTITDANGCADTSSYTVVNGRLSVTASVDSTPVNPGTVVTLNALVLLADTNITYIYMWAPDTSKDSVSNPKIQSPTAAPTVTTLYSVTVTDPLTGCSGTDTVTVVVDSVSLFAFPSAFTPNGDGHNDFFGIITAGNVTLEDFKIYDRWGALVHDTPVPWDGQVGGKDQPVGTYVFTAVIQYVDLTTNTSHTINYKGQVTLLR